MMIDKDTDMPDPEKGGTEEVVEFTQKCVRKSLKRSLDLTICCCTLHQIVSYTLNRVFKLGSDFLHIV